MNKFVIGLLIAAGIAILIGAWYWLWYLPNQTDAGIDQPIPLPEGSPCTLTLNRTIAATTRQGIIRNGVCVPVENPRITGIEASNIVTASAPKDSYGYSTINFNGDFTRPNLSTYPTAALQNLLSNGWWISLLKGGTLNGYQAGSNGNYILGIYDLRDPNATINAGKTVIAVPPALQPYLVL